MLQSTFQAKRVSQGVISYLKKQQQLHLLPQVAKETLQASRSHTDPNIAHVIAAIPLSDTEQATLKSNLDQLFSRPLNLDLITDPSIIGGLIIKVGDQVIDQSLNHQINQLTDEFKL